MQLVMGSRTYFLLLALESFNSVVVSHSIKSDGV